MGGVVTKNRKDDDSDIISIPNDDIYADDARDAVELALNKKSAQTMIELTISCQNLPKLDFLSQTDAKVVCYVEEGGNFFRHDSTEVIPDCPNPCFEKKIIVPYNFEKPQTLKFEIYDVDEFKEQDLLDKQELIGYVTLTLHQIVCSPNQTVSKEIIGNQTRKNRARKCGIMNLTGKEIDEVNNRITFHITFTPFFSKNEFRMDLAPSDNAESASFKMFDLRSHNKKGLDWSLTITPSKTLTYDNSRIKFRILEKVKPTKRVMFGEAEAYLSDALNTGFAKARVKRNGYDVGELKIKEVKKATRYTFLNYVDAGAEISLIIALDFTKSNKEPTNPKSLHYILNDQDNEYLQALKSIGGILQYYDSDNKIPLYGFGAKLPPYFNVVSNCFSLNGNYFDPEVYGLEEVIKVYKEALVKYKFHGPTIFSELLRMASEYAKSENLQGENQKYFILLVLTDGDINDFEKTKDEVVRASKLPMSIIIIGVGDDEFTQMNALDGDEEVVVSSTGEACVRDIVQFVPFSKYKHDPQQLAKKTLEEVPKQFLEYMTVHKIDPTKNGRKNRFIEKSNVQASDRLNTGEKSKEKSTFLEQEREKFSQELRKLEMDPKLIDRILDQGVPAPNINLVIEMISHQKFSLLNSNHLQKAYPSIEVDMFKEKLAVASTVKTLKKNPKIKVKQFNSPKDKGYELEKLKPKETTFKITHDILNNKGEQNQQNQEEEEYSYDLASPKQTTHNFFAHSFSAPHGREVVKFDLDDPQDHLIQLTKNTNPFTIEENTCLHCRRRAIDTVLMPCGHAAFCSKCLGAQLKKTCGICKQKIGYFTTTKR